MEYYSPGAPSSFPGRQASGTTDPSGEAVLLSLPWREEWHPRHGAPSAPSVAMETGSEEAVWRMTLQTRDGMDTPQHPYPERPGEPDCAYYMRTGLCGFGMGCRFNHPSNRRLAAAATRNRGELPERIGQPECQYYLKTGSCKFGATCKYHHPRDKAAYAARARLNMLNLPLRPGERDCSYYMRMRTCKYGVTCKFNHPEPEPAIGTLVSMQGSGQFFRGGSGSSPAAQPYPAGLQAWSITGAPYLASPRLPGPSNFASVLLSPHQSLIPMPAWSAYQGHGLPLPSPDRQQQALRANYVYGAAAQQDPVAFHHGSQAAFPAYMPGAGQLPTPPSPSTSGSKEKVYYPERPGQPECQYYMRTGDCKFGLTCRYHHPRDRNASSALVLSPMGLPLRPGAPPCTFYTRHGYCRFGPTCKFDHPFVALPYSPSAPPLGDVSVASLSTGSSPTILAPPTETPIQLIRHSATAGSSIEPTSSSSGPQASHRQSSSRGSLEEEDMPSRRIDSIEGENIAAQGSTVGAPLSSGTANSPEIHGVL